MIPQEFETELKYLINRYSLTLEIGRPDYEVIACIMTSLRELISKRI